MTRRSRKGRAAAALALLLGVAAAVCAAGNARAEGLKVGEAAPPFAGKDTEGAPVDLPALVGKSRAVLVNFWGLRCGACLEEMPVLASLHEKYNPRGLSILGVNVDGVGADTIKAHLPRVAKVPPYPLVTDEELKIADLYKMNAAPLTVLVDSGGKVAYVHEGYKAGDEAAMVEILEKLVR